MDLLDCTCSGVGNGNTVRSLDARGSWCSFDDGPGSQTLALSSYLKSRGIRATFFVNGHCFGQGVYQSGQCQQDASASPFDILGRLVADGHLVANHTQDHFDLTSLDDNSIVRQLADTDA
jgi:peptidoglycan/xylan/chitin deacetylase (PgdA/CDA1 family)